MIVLQGYQEIPENFGPSVITIGNFDGVHRAHARIIQRTMEKAKEKHARSVVYTFRPHPQAVLHAGGALKLLSTYEEKIERLGGLGPEYCIEEPFNLEFSAMRAAEFFEEVLLRRLRAKAIVVGHDFGFGKNREGNLKSLAEFCTRAEVELEVVDSIEVEEQLVSSSAIRAALTRGDVIRANRMLGYAFTYRGRVVHGEGRGKTLGFPTANIQIEPKLPLPLGVYVTRLRRGKDSWFSVTNIGVRPTFVQTGQNPPMNPVIETHIPEEDSRRKDLYQGLYQDLYGEEVALSFFTYLRPEKKFASVEDLKARIGEDIRAARRVWEEGHLHSAQYL